MSAPFATARRILALAPHPDDEVVAYAGATGRARDAGADVFVLYLTTGLLGLDTQPPWRRRRHADRVSRRNEEAWRAAELLGLNPVRFLRYDSRSLRRRMPDAREAIARVVREQGIDTLWAPAYEGGHADHDVVNALAASFAAEVSVFEFAAYNNAGGRTNLQTFPHLNGSETVFELDVREQALKRHALALYRSERRNLSYVEHRRETARPMSDHDYSRPPHEGSLFYERFHWVPFCHPAIDRTTGSDVCAAIGDFSRTRQGI